MKEQQQRWKVETKGRESGLASWAAAAKGEGVFSLSGGSAFSEPHTCLDDGIFWSDHGGNSQDLVVCGTRGIDLYKVSLARAQCKLVRSLLYPASNVWYAPNFRCIVLGSGTLGTELRPYLLKSRVSDMPKFELPPPTKVKKFQLYAADWQRESSQQLRRDQVCLVSLYGSLVVAHTSTDNSCLTLYWIDRTNLIVHDAVLRLPLTGSSFKDHKISVTTHDDVLIVTRLVKSEKDPSFFKIENTLLFDVYGWENAESPESNTLVIASNRILVTKLFPLSSDSSNHIFQTSEQNLVYLKLNLETIAQAKSKLGHRRELTIFLLRRAGSRQLLASLVREIILHGQIDTIDDIFELIADRERQILTTSRMFQYHVDNGCETNGKSHQDSPKKSASKNKVRTSFEFSQSDIVSYVFSQLEELSARERADALIAYVWALHRRKVPISEILARETAAQLLAADELRELAQLIHFKVLPDSRPLAYQLLAHSHAHSAGLDQLGLDILHRLKSPAHLARALASSGRLHDAFRLVSFSTHRDATELLFELVALLVQADSNNKNNTSLESECRRLLLIALAGGNLSAAEVSGDGATLSAQLSTLFSSPMIAVNNSISPMSLTNPLAESRHSLSSETSSSTSGESSASITTASPSSATVVLNARTSRNQGNEDK